MNSSTCIDKWQDEKDIKEYLEASNDNIVVCHYYGPTKETYYCESRSELLSLMLSMDEDNSTWYPKYEQITRGFRYEIPEWDLQDKDDFISSLEDINNCFYKINVTNLALLDFIKVSNSEVYTYDEIMFQL